ncbi:MAG: hypothetical protein ABSA75_05395 [Candidatus Bathyarchaeia archaeon]
MSTKKTNLLELSDSERMRILNEAKMSLLRQVEEARLYQSFTQIPDCKC